jgi:glutamate-ammonia-ligase adenylyltransferase
VAFTSDYSSRSKMNRKILDHLLHDAFSSDGTIEPEVDLVNDPDPPKERIEQVLGRYPFEDVPAAYENLMALATEKIRFLSTRRCRHFLAAIAPRLLAAIAATPEPDATLMNLSRVSDSLGGKAALWELFSANRPSLNLYVTLCAACPYLAGVLTSNPGMIDELLDSLLVEHLPTLSMLEETLAELCRGAEDLEPILHSFKNSQHLRVGVRDVLGKDDVRATHAALSDIAEACLKQIAASEYTNLVEKFGEPTIQIPSESEPPSAGAVQQWQRFADREGDVCEPVVLALGKLGGRELGYAADLDVVFVYTGDEGESPVEWFSRCAQRLLGALHQRTPRGRLYEVDTRLRPSGSQGLLVTSLAGWRRYHADVARLWERQALTKLRPVAGDRALGEQVARLARETVYGAPPDALGGARAIADEIGRMRERIERELGSKLDLKVGAGGVIDIEFAAQYLQLAHGHAHPALRTTSTVEALRAAARCGVAPAHELEILDQGYRFLRGIEHRLRVVHDQPIHRLPETKLELDRLARRAGFPDGAVLLAHVERWQRDVRAAYSRLLFA